MRARVLLSAWWRGPAALPVVVAYPPDWTVDDSLFPDQAIISINGPSGNDTVEIDGAAQQSGANIDVLRDEFFNKKTAFCDAKGIEMTATRPVSGVPFAVLGATCEQSSELFYLPREHVTIAVVLRPTHLLTSQQCLVCHQTTARSADPTAPRPSRSGTWAKYPSEV